MKITELLNENGIELNAKVHSKKEVIDLLIDLQYSAGNISDIKVFEEGIIARESQGTTGIGEGIAIPHSKNSAVKRPGLAAVTVPEGLDYESLDGEPTNLLFMIAAPEKAGNVHLEVLSRLSTILMDEDFRKDLLNAKSKKEFLDIIDKKEIEKFGHEEKKEEFKDGYRVLAVTACPTGIAHTFMAAEALEKKGKEMGYSIKVETNGSSGIKNALSKKDIEEADGIIVAADKNVEMARFNGKRVLKVKVADGIHKPKELIDKIINKEAPVYHAENTETSEENVSDESFGRKIYKHLMNGISHMLPFVIGGGILIAIAFLLDNYEIDPSNFGMNTPVAAFFKTIGGVAFDFLLPVLAGFIAMSIADRPGLVVGFVGGTLADFGISFTNISGDVSAGFLGALLAGFLAGYIVLLLKKIFSYLPQALEGIKPVLLYPVFGVLLIGVIICLINPYVALLNSALINGLNSMGGTSKILLGVILGGMMAIDMGGPFNKAAYVFGTAAIASGGFDIMAAVMAGGMVPPLAIALCTTFFKNKFTPDERKSGIVNYVMGLCFITEGAIPFAAADPLRVIPSCVVGSAVAGGISMFMGCTLRAPHGGIFVLPVIGNVFGFLLALLIGSIAGMLLLAVLRKKPNEI